jgi:hypothetical protein
MPWRHFGERRYSSSILDLGTRWRRMVGFTPRPLYSRGNFLRYPLDRRLVEPQSRSGRCGEEENLAPAGIPSPAVQPAARSYTDRAGPTHEFTFDYLKVVVSYKNQWRAGWVASWSNCAFITTLESKSCVWPEAQINDNPLTLLLLLPSRLVIVVAYSDGHARND